MPPCGINLKRLACFFTNILGSHKMNKLLMELSIYIFQPVCLSLLFSKGRQHIISLLIVSCRALCHWLAGRKIKMLTFFSFLHKVFNKGKQVRYFCLLVCWLGTAGSSLFLN